MWEIKDRNGAIKATAYSLEYSGEWMGECYVTVSVESPSPINFIIGDYLEYRGERFEINYEPSVIKCAPRYAKGDSFQYKDIKFNSLADELTRCDFLDVVLNDNNIHYTSLPNFSFFAATIRDLANRIRANLNRLYPGLWTVICNEELAEKTDVNVSVNNIKVWGALQIAVNDFGCNFTIKGRTITLGVEGMPTAHLFKYGKGSGLYELERTVENNQEIITRLRAYGSTKNLPLRYYNRIGERVLIPIEQVLRYYIANGQTTGEVALKLESFGKLEDGQELQVEINGKQWPATYFHADYQTQSNCILIQGMTKSEILAIKAGETKMLIASGASVNDFSTRYVDTSGVVLPNNMAITNLMLPGFPDMSLRDHIQVDEEKPLCSDNQFDPYIDSANKDVIGLREGTVFFDGSGDLDEIYPSMEGMTADLLKAAGGWTLSVGNLDELQSAELVEDNGLPEVEGDKNNPQTDNFVVYLKDVGFNLWDYRASESPTISFKSGMLGGREFEIVKCERITEGVIGYKLTCKRTYDDAIQLWFPYCDYNAKAGDKFVLLNIEMPDCYIKVASQCLYEAAKEYLAKNDYSRNIHQPKIDEIFMARQHDLAMASNGKIESLHDTIKEGMKLLFEDSDLNIDGSIYIERLTIKEGDGLIPTYDVTLKEEKTVSTLTKIQNKIDSILTGKLGKTGGGSGYGYSASEIRNFVFAYGKERFLGKLEPDEAQYLIKLLGGAEFGKFHTGTTGAEIDADGNAEVESIKVRTDTTVGNGLSVGEKIEVGTYIPGVQGGTFYVDANGEAHIDTAYITVNKKMQVKEVEIQQQSYVGGAQIISPAAMTCQKVEPVYDDRVLIGSSQPIVAWRCMFRASDSDGNVTENHFRVGDLARCETFNLEESSAGMTENRYYWRRVMEVGKDWDANGDEWGYIDLSIDNCDPDSNCSPIVADRIVTVGNDSDPDRQNIIIIAACGEGSPYIYQFAGINSYSLGLDRCKTRISPNGNLFTGEFKVTTKKGDVGLNDYIDQTTASSFEVTNNAITAATSKIDTNSKRIANLQLTADGLSSSVAKISTNLMPESPNWVSGSGDFDAPWGDDKTGSFAFEQMRDLTSEYQTFRCRIDSSKLNPDTDYTLSFDLSVNMDGGGEQWPTSVNLRSSICNTSQSSFNAAWVQAGDNTIIEGETIHKVFRLHTSDSIKSGSDWLSLVFYLGDVSQDNPIDIRFDGVKLEQGAIATPFNTPSSSIESQIQQQADSIAMAVKVDGVERAGLTLDADNGITLDADKVRVVNNGDVATLFTNGSVNANLLNVGKLMTIVGEKKRITLSEFDDGFMRFYNEDGVTLAMKVGLEKVYIEGSGASKIDEGGSTRVSSNDTATLITHFGEGELAIIQVYDEDGNLTWALFPGQGAVTPDNQTFSWRSYSLVPPPPYFGMTKEKLELNQTLKATEYWQFLVKSGATVEDRYSKQANKLFYKRLSDSEFASATPIEDGDYYFPTPEQQIDAKYGTLKWIRRFYRVTNGKPVYSSNNYIELKD